MAQANCQLPTNRNLTNAVADSQCVHLTLVQLCADAARDHGYTVSDFEAMCRVTAADDMPGEDFDAYVIPDFMTDGSGVREQITSASNTNSPFAFRIREAKDGEGDVDAAGIFTLAVQERDMTAAEVVAHLVETGQFDKAVAHIRPFCRDDVNPVDAVVWAVSTYLKGVVAEQALANSDAPFDKAGGANEKAGDDVYDRTPAAFNMRQVKCVTCPEDEAPEHTLWYQFDNRGRLHYGDDRKATYKAAIDGVTHVGHGNAKGTVINGSLTARTNTDYPAETRPYCRGDRGGTYRYIGW